MCYNPISDLHYSPGSDFCQAFRHKKYRTAFELCGMWKTYSHPARIYNSFIMPESGECGSGKVIGEFVCDDIIVDERGENADVFSKYAQLSLVEQKKYGANKPLFGWHITDLKIYYKPKELWEFSSYGCKIVGDCCINYDCPNCIDNGWMQPPDCKIDGCYLTRPPQSWCYVEELE